MKIQKRFIAFLIVTCLGFCLCGCNSVAKGDVSGKEYTIPTTNDTENLAQQDEVEETTEHSAEQSNLYEVLSTNTEVGTMNFWNINAERQEQYSYSDGTYYLNKYGQNTSLSSMMPGKIVTINISNQTAALTQVQVSDEAWEYDDISKFSIDEQNNIITIADIKYYYGKNLSVFSEENTIELDEISDKDILRIQGIGREILSISVTTGHGTIQLDHTEIFEGGWLSLGTKMYLQITENMQIEVAEGTYLLSVANDGYGGSKEITVSRGEETKIDLDELKGEGPKYCEITFVVDVKDAALSIDGEKVDDTKPVQVRYGIHQLQIDAAGYDTWSKKLFVNSEEATIDVALDTEATTTSTETETSSSTSETSSATTSTATTSTTSTSSTTDTSASTQTYLDTLSNIISTLTGSSSSSD